MIGRILPILALAIATGSVVAAPPFVAGYDRFAGSQPIQAGRVLLSELSCTACHAVDHETLKPKKGPTLVSAGQRLQMDWVRQFLAAPAETKPGTTMPNIFAMWDSAEKQAAISALVAFLMTQQESLPPLKSTASNPIAQQFWSKGDASRGKTLYHQVGCVACHEPDGSHPVASQPNATLDEETLEELGITPERPIHSVPHPRLSEKYSSKSLTHFLLDPLAARPSGRMPDLKLKPNEAADIAAFLLADRVVQVSTSGSALDADLVTAGSRLFQELGCANCHTADGAKPKRLAPALTKLSTGKSSSCISNSHRGLPYYSVDDSQRAAIRQAIANPRVVDSVDHRMRQLNCYACHERAGRGGVGPNRRQFFETVGQVDLGDEGRIPPSLDGVGRKLTNGWMKKVFAGSGDIRPHLNTRMPIFGDVTNSLVEEFAGDDLPESKPDPFPVTKSSAEAGRTLLDLGCVQCHPLRGERLPGVIGTDLAEINKRVRPEWFREFILDPASLKNRTRMPTFFRNGKSPNPEILDGDVEEQVASLWVYLSEIGNHPLPDKIQQGRAHNFELVPQDKPIVIRTFMDRAGPHAIAVGFPGRTHLAFDAETVRVAQLWKGRFLDAHGTWFDRFTPPAKPLGSEVIEMPQGGAFALSPSGELPTYQFRGYRLDRSSVPTFLYRFDDVDVEDRLTPTAENGFQRRLRLTSTSIRTEPKRVWFRALVGRELKRQSKNSYWSEQGLAVAIQGNLDGGSRIETIDGEGNWLIPIDVKPESEIIVRYTW